MASFVALVVNSIFSLKPVDSIFGGVGGTKSKQRLGAQSTASLSNYQPV